jgi:glycosyltransferase involved in cell wall biosynthesis
MVGLRRLDPSAYVAPLQLSAVVLCYNKREEIVRFAGSLSRQTRKPDHVLVVDDCSTDAPASYYRDVLKPWPLIRLPKNKGQGHARNIGASFLKDDLIIFLDGDIEMEPHMLQKLEEALIRNPQASISYSHYDRIGTRTDHVRALPWDLNRLRVHNYVSMISMIRRADMPNPPFDETLDRYEDWDLWLTMAEAGKSGVMVPEILFSAYYKAGDLSGTGESASWYSAVKEKHRLKK